MRISLNDALSLLQQGNVVAIPTDTVYGLAADMNNPQAVNSIFEIKNRPQDKPLIVLFSQFSQIASWILEIPPGFNDLATKFWPGALTLIVPIDTQMISSTIRSNLPTAGFRIPHHPLLIELLNHFGPLVAPSANLSGKPSATTPEHVEQDFGKDFPVLDGGPCAKGVESTLLMFQGNEWKIVRQGAVLSSEIEGVLGYAPKIFNEKASNPQYSSKASLILGNTPYDGKIKTVLGFSDRSYPSAEKIFLLGPLSQPDLIAQKLFSLLREIDTESVQEIWVDMDFPKEGILAAVAERLEKAARKSR